MVGPGNMRLLPVSVCLGSVFLLTLHSAFSPISRTRMGIPAAP
ncbi:MAG: hypothetical protein M0Q44_19705 [Methylobacter sp.]|nr:hypothetical protein [Methylobacter sp.]